MTTKINTKIINLFAGPSKGKSTTTAGLFYLMKIKGYNVELIDEYAKQITWDDRPNILEDQLYILAKQNRKIKRLIGKVHFVVTDSPIILGLNYMPKKYYKTFTPFVLDVWNSYDNRNFFLENDGKLTYQKVGRNQTEKEADVINDTIKKCLHNNKIRYTPIKIISNEVNPMINHVNSIFKHVEKE